MKCGTDGRVKRMQLTNCSANPGEAAHADSATHLNFCGKNRQRHSAAEVSLLEMLKKAQYGWGWRREVTLYSPGEGNNVPKKWKSDLAGYDPSGNLCVIDVNVITLAAASYRGTRRTLRSRCLRA